MVTQTQTQTYLDTFGLPSVWQRRVLPTNALGLHIGQSNDGTDTKFVMGLHYRVSRARHTVGPNHFRHADQ